MVLKRINSPADLKGLSARELAVLASEIREYLVKTVSENGGHLASSLGVVELTIALHRAFNSPEDKIIWDVGHQCYAHKLLTGRKDKFDTLRQYGGLSGFPGARGKPARRLRRRARRHLGLGGAGHGPGARPARPEQPRRRRHRRRLPGRRHGPGGRQPRRAARAPG